jgi:hypothetical protein
LCRQSCPIIQLQRTLLRSEYGSYFPASSTADKSIQQTDIQKTYLFGVKITTVSHQFFIYAGNMMETGAEPSVQLTALHTDFVVVRREDAMHGNHAH